MSALSILLAIALVIGMLIGSLYTLSQLVKLRWQVKRLEKENKKQLDNIVQLKKEAVTAKSLASEKTAKMDVMAIESLESNSSRQITIPSIHHCPFALNYSKESHVSSCPN